MGDRYNIHSQLEHLQSKYIGTGHADTTKWEWMQNQHRDTVASILGHFDMLNHVAIAENENKARLKFNLIEKMLQPTGPPSQKKEDT
ncbi:putative splicing factor 3B subunit 5 [Hypsibius exemplaris]|uniref:Splicing factor 3B subunit 5 n=1 Tax=Hypsibius exemplaris TaxID=2072580 RepID=A0A1W0W970_HYPEX|nr:putative splicing factor 3B subunit 5 [Hypsibius exemplaris]